MYKKFIDIIHIQKNQWRQRRWKFFWGGLAKKNLGYLEEGEGRGLDRGGGGTSSFHFADSKAALP